MIPLKVGGLVLRLLVVVVVVGILAAGVGTVLLSSAARSAARTEALQRNAAIAHELSVRLTGRIANTRDILRIIAADPEVVRLDESSSSYLRAVLRASPAFDELVLYSGDGRPVTAAANAFAAELHDYPARPDLSEPATLEAYTRVTDEFPAMFELAAPVEDPPGTTVGFLLARMPLEMLAAPIQQFDVTGRSRRFLVDASGTVLVHPERDRILARERVPLARIEPVTRTGTIDMNGQRLLAATAAIDGFAGAIVVAQDEALVLGSVSRRLLELVGILLAVLAATMLAVSLVGERLLRPLRPLADAANRLARGERGVRVPVTGSGEIATLSTAFDHMAETIDRRDAQLLELQRLSLLVNASAHGDGLADDLVRGAQMLLQAQTCAFTALVDGHRPTVTATVGEEVDESVLRQLAGASLSGGATDGVPAPSATLTVPVTTLSGTNLGLLTAIRPTAPFSGEELVLAEAFAAFAGVALDNARRLQLEQALVYQLQEGIERRRLIIGGLTHEFRTPLTCIEGFSSELIEHWQAHTDEERTTLLGKVQAHTMELDRLVSQLLEFAATERGMTTPALSVVLLRSIVEQELSSLQPLLEGRELAIDVPDVEVFADPRLLRRILDNLVSNAIKYSRPGTPVSVRGEVDADVVRLHVVDQGVGMTARELDRAFQPFWRAPGVRSQRGTGLGLALVGEYVRTMDGTLTAQSKPGKGSTFSFTLRLRGPEVPSPLGEVN